MLAPGSESIDKNLALVWPEFSSTPEPSLQYCLVLLFQEASGRLVLTGVGKEEVSLNVNLFRIILQRKTNFYYNTCLP